MKNLQFTRFAQIAPTPWKNGRGKTVQLAIHPLDATNENFEWRVSIARLDTSAAFSVFDGVERCLAVLQGEMTLLRPAHKPLVLTPASRPARFGGHEAVEGKVMRGPVIDLNIMYKISHWKGSLRRVTCLADRVLSLSPSEFLCSLSERIDFEAEGNTLHLSLFDLVKVHQKVAVRIKASAIRPVAAYVITLRGRLS